MSNPHRPSNMLSFVFASIAALFVLFVIGAIINHIANEFQSSNKVISLISELLPKKT